MAADFESGLKRAWTDKSSCRILCTYDPDRCGLHAALLEMVDAYSLRLPGPRKRQYTDKERRRLRAAVGVKEEGDDAKPDAVPRSVQP